MSLINGSKDAISDVVKLLMKLMKQRLDELGEPGDVDRQLRIVVPNSTIGMVIGKVYIYIYTYMGWSLARVGRLWSR